MDSHFYSIIIPVYNEIDLIPSLLKSLESYHKGGHEIIIVDDGSNDGSNKILHDNNFIKSIIFENNKGKGIAVKEGIQNAINEKLIIFDGDLEIHPDQIQSLMLLNSKENIRYVLANRFRKKQINSLWNIGNKIFTAIFNYQHRSKIKDALCCAKAFYKSDIDVRSLKSQKFDIDIELLSRLIKIDSKVKSVDIKYHRRNSNQGKKLKLSDSFKIILRMLDD